jgi:hypothetical protein
MKKPSAPLMLLLALLVSFNAFSLPVLNSLPAARATIYLDFDGQNVTNAYWKGGTPFFCDPAGMTDAQVTEIFNRVAEDYRPLISILQLMKINSWLHRFPAGYE